MLLRNTHILFVFSSWVLLSFSCQKKEVVIQDEFQNNTEITTTFIDSLAVLKADSLMELGRTMYSQKKFAASWSALTKADSIYVKNQQWTKNLKNWYNIITLAQAMGVPHDSINALFTIAEGFVEKVPENHPNIGYLYQKKSFVSNLQVAGVDAKYYAEKALEIFSKSTSKQSITDQIEVLNDLTSIAANLYDYDEATAYAEQAFMLAEDNNINKSKVAVTLFYAYLKQGNARKVNQLISKMNQEHIIEDALVYDAFSHYTDRAAFYTQQEKYDKALAVIEMQNELIASSPYKLHFAGWYKDQAEARIHLKKKDYKKVINILSNTSYDSNNENTIKMIIAEDKFLLARSYYSLNDFKRSKLHIQESINMHFIGQSSDASFFEKTSYKQTIAKDRLLYKLAIKAKICSSEYLKSKNPQYSNIEKHCYQQMHLLLQELGDKSAEDKFIDSEEFKTMYNRYLNLMHTEWIQSKSDSVFYEALTIADQSKVNTITNEISKINRAKLFKSVPENLLKKEKELQKAIYELQITNKLGAVDGSIDSLKKELRGLKQTFKTKYPRYYSIAYEPNNGIEQQINRYFSEDNIIQFMVGDTDVFVFKKYKDSLQFDKIPFSEETQQNVSNYIKYLKNPNDTVHYNARSLYDKFFKNYLVSDVPTVLVLDDIFHSVPVKALVAQSGDETMKNTSFRRVNSLIRYITREEENKRKTLIMAPFSAKNKSAYFLPKSLDESKSIQKTFNADLKLNESATKKFFIDNASKYDVIHIASHSTVNNDNPLRSAIYFSQETSDVPSETQLLAEDLYTMQIDADFVALSSCETGVGLEQKGKGIQSLSSAFAYAGVSSTLMSLWEVPDTQTQQVMASFYNYLHTGHTKDDALLKAQEDYLATTKIESLKHPYYWAGFVISGDNKPLKGTAKTPLYLIIGSTLLFVLFGFYGYKKTRKS